MKKTIGIIGYGFVGRAVSQLSEVYEVNIYDPFVEQYSSLENKNASYLSDYVVVCVPTPTNSDGSLELGLVDSCVSEWSTKNRNSLDLKNKESILIIKSTIEPGTIKKLSRKHNTKKIVHNPEFLTQRTAMEDFRNPVEVIVGGEDPKVVDSVLNLYRGYYVSGDREPKYYGTSSKMAELVKITRNSFYAVKVSYFNEIKELCTKIDVDYKQFREIFTLGGDHPWISKQHTQVPGPDGKVGFGGACLPKDSQGLVELSETLGVSMTTLKGAIKSNKRRR